MPSGPRIRTDNVFGTITDNPLTAGATTMNSAGLANLAAVSSAHAIIIIDPLRTAGAPEAVVVTAHTGSATSATITRGAYGTSAREHASGVLWVHAPTIEDFIRIVTSSTRPSDPYEGQLIYETDTDRFVASTGAAWVRQGRVSSTGRTGVRLRRAATQSIPDAAETAISWDTEDSDSDGFITVTASTITVPSGLGGLYSITFQGSLPTNPSTSSYCRINAGGISYFNSMDQVGGGANQFWLSLADIPLAAADTVQALVFQDHSGAQNFTGRLTMFWNGP